MKKTLYTLNIGDYAPEICAMTYPLLRHYAKRIGAEFHVITERKYPDWPITYEKIQIKDLATQRRDDLAVYVDSDALIHPETVDFSIWLPRNTVAHNGTDMAAVRWKYDKYFRRDGRHIGSCNWMTWAWSDCFDLWEPLDIPFAEARENIYPTMGELVPVVTEVKKQCPSCKITFQQPQVVLSEDGEPVLAPQVIDRDHLIDDYTLSRNIARYGLKATTLMKIQEDIGLKDAQFLWHSYEDPVDRKIELIKDVVRNWRTTTYLKRIDG